MEPSTSDKPTLTPEIITGLWSASDVRVSPNGERVAWTASAFSRSGDYDDSAIWLAPADGSAVARRWTYGGTDTSPRWSPDGSSIAFLSDRSNRGTAGLYLIRLAGGEAEQLVARERSITALAWSPDGKQIAFLVPEEPDEEDKRRETEKDDADLYGERWRCNRLHIIDLDSAMVTHLDAPNGHLVALDWSGSGTELAVIAWPEPVIDAVTRGTVHVVRLAEGGTTHSELAVCPGASDLKFTSDGKSLVFVAFQDTNPVSSATVWMVPTDNNEAARVIGPSIDEPACGVEVVTTPGHERPLIVTARGLTTFLEWGDPSGEREILLTAEGDIDALSLATDSALAVVQCSLTQAGEVWAGRPGSLRQLSNHQTVLHEIDLGRVEDFIFTGHDGTELDGILIKPPAGVTGGEGPWPTVVLPHGGPYGRYGRDLHLAPLDWGQWLATAGYAVILPNYRGGLGQGHKVASSLRGRMGQDEWGDVLSSVDAAVERGIADPARLGIGGWSQGGYLSAWGITQTDRFKAAIVGAGVTDWRVLVATSDAPSFEAALAGGEMWQAQPRASADSGSPWLYAEAVTTPVLFLHGQKDERVPLSQAAAFHRALRELGRTTELVSYPREPHVIREKHHQEDILRRVREWYDRWLKA